MRLTDLEPQWVGAGGEGVSNADGTPAPERHGVGLSFKCPCGQHDEWDRVYVGFANPIDGGPAFESGSPKWQRTGDTFETLQLSPSIQRHQIGKHGCTWHGYIGLTIPGEVTTL